jgi:hypothetical protein
MLFKTMKSQDAVLGIKSVIFYNLLQGLLPFVSDTSPNKLQSLQILNILYFILKLW